MTDQIRHINPNGGAWHDNAAGLEALRAEQERQFAAPAQRLADHDLLAAYATDALAEARFELAAELSRLAFRARAWASRSEAARTALFGPGPDRVRNVPLIGRTRDEQPREEPMSHAPSVCTARNDQAGTECHQPIAWAPGWFGDENRAAQGAGWYHLDPEITDHDAVAALR